MATEELLNMKLMKFQASKPKFDMNQDTLFLPRKDHLKLLSPHSNLLVELHQEDQGQSDQTRVLGQTRVLQSQDLPKEVLDL